MTGVMVGLDWAAAIARMDVLDPDRALDAQRVIDLCQAVETGALAGAAATRERNAEG